MGVWISIKLCSPGVGRLEQIRPGGGRRGAREWTEATAPSAGIMTELLLQVRDLTVHLRSPAAVVLDGVGFDLAPGETVGILGESGAGKTTLAKALVRLLPPDCWAVEGSFRFRGSEILGADERQLRKIRGAQISVISQEPELSLNPVMVVGRQVDEVLRAHASLDGRSRREEVDSMLAAVGLPEPDLYRAYPHELSGGQRQRAAIALALISKPPLLIADEPTSALDNVTQAAILDLLKRLRDRLQLALVFITHNPVLLSGLADQVMVMRAGRVVEVGSFRQIFWKPNHPYTQELLRSIPPMPGKLERARMGLGSNLPDQRTFEA